MIFLLKHSFHRVSVRCLVKYWQSSAIWKDMTQNTTCSFVYSQEHAEKLLDISSNISDILPLPVFLSSESIDSFSPWLLAAPNARYVTPQIQKVRLKGHIADSGFDTNLSAVTKLTKWWTGITSKNFHYVSNNGCYRQNKSGDKSSLLDKISMNNMGELINNTGNLNLLDQDNKIKTLVSSSESADKGNNQSEFTKISSKLNEFSNSPAEMFSDAVAKKSQLSHKAESIFSDNFVKSWSNENSSVRKLSFTKQNSVGQPVKITDSTFLKYQNNSEGLHTILRKKESSTAINKSVSANDLVNFRAGDKTENSLEPLPISNKNILAPVRESTHLSLLGILEERKLTDSLSFVPDTFNTSGQSISMLTNSDNLWRVHKSVHPKKSRQTENQFVNNNPVLLASGDSEISSLSSVLPIANAVDTLEILPETVLQDFKYNLDKAQGIDNVMLTESAMTNQLFQPNEQPIKYELSQLKPLKPFHTSLLPNKNLKHEKIEPVFLDNMLPEISGRRVSVAQTSRRIL